VEKSVAYLAESHGDGSVISASGQTAGSTCTSRGGNTSLRGSNSLDTLAATSTAAKQASEELALSSTLLGSRDVVLDTDTARGSLVGRGGGTAHESTNHDGSIDVAVALSASERASLAAGNLTVTDDCSVCLRTATAVLHVSVVYYCIAWYDLLGRAVTGSAIGNCETRHLDTVGSSDLGNDTVSRDGGREGSDEGVLCEVHFEGSV
jgi:hypothetical protein